MLHFGLNMPFYLMMLYGSAMIVMVLILRALFKNRLPKFVFPVLWGLVLLRFLIPFSLSSPISLPVPSNLLASYGAITEIAESTMIVEDASMPEAGTGTAQTQEMEIPMDNLMQVQISDVVTAVEGTAVGDTYDYLYRTPLFGYMLFNLLPIVYVLGLVTVAGILGWQKYHYLKKLRRGYLIEHNETVNEMLRNLNMGHVLVFTNDEIASPMVSGLLNSRIYLPTGMDFENRMLLSHVLAHETMHIRRRDNWVKLIMLVVLCLNWYNPLVWLMAKCLASDLEAACDAAVLRQCGEEAKKEYAYSLLAMAVSGTRTSLLYSAFSKTEVEKRVNHILHYKKATFFVMMVTVLFLAGSITAFSAAGQAPFWTDLTAYCASSSSRWGVDVSITRDIALGKNAQERAEDVVLSVLSKDETGDPKVIEDLIKTGLAEEFGVEKGAFYVATSLCLDPEEVAREYAAWDILKDDGLWTCQGEKVRIYEDKMLGSYYSNADGTVDIAIQRNELGEIVSVDVWHPGDREFTGRSFY